MTRYVALIRALNVGGTSVIKMTDVKKMFESFGLEGVSTYIQSGNVVFESKESTHQKLAEKIEKGIKASWNKELRVFVADSKRLQKAADHNPFRPGKDEEVQSQIMFLSDKPRSANQKAMMEHQGKEYRFAFWDNFFYFAYSKEWAGKRRNLNFEKMLGVYGTARTWKVVDALIKLSK